MINLVIVIQLTKDVIDWITIKKKIKSINLEIILVVIVKIILNYIPSIASLSWGYNIYVRKKTHTIFLSLKYKRRNKHWFWLHVISLTFATGDNAKSPY